MNTAISNTPEFDNCIDLIKNMVSNLPDDKLKHNYSYDRLKVDEWVAVSVFEGGCSDVAGFDIAAVAWIDMVTPLLGLLVDTPWAHTAVVKLSLNLSPGSCPHLSNNTHKAWWHL